MLLAEFLDYLVERRKLMADAVARGRWTSAVDSDRYTVEGVAHSMSGSAAQLGAQRLAAASRKLETHAKLVTPGALKAVLEQAEQSREELERAADELVALCDGAPSLESLFTPSRAPKE